MREFFIFEMNELLAKSNILNRVRNTKLPKTKPLLPLFELISNSIHAINEAKEDNLLNEDGEIEIRLIRNGDDSVLKKLENIDIYPIKSIQVIDNGIGLNDVNLNCFAESDTDHKLTMGGKGVGRFVCLKAFKKLEVRSRYKSNGSIISREFEFKPTKEGFQNFVEKPNSSTNVRAGTEILLSDFIEEYQKNAPKELMNIATEIIIHFQLYFIQKNAPKIILKDQNDHEANLNQLFESDFDQNIKVHEFEIGENKFSLFLTKSSTAQSHKLLFCAHNRIVKEEGLSTRIIDLGKNSIKDDKVNFYYQAFVVGDILDEYVDNERVGFNFPNEDSEETEDENSDEITLSKIRKGALHSIESILSEYFNTVREKKIEKYRPTIYNELPQYRSTLNYKIEEIKRLPPDLSTQKLDIELYKISANWKLEVKEAGMKLLEGEKDITNIEEYKSLYKRFVTQFNEIGQSELARYVIHRKSIIELLEKLIGQNTNGKFTNEELIHSIFFPIRTTSDEIPHTKQNLWLLDERLTYHNFLSSDKSFESSEKYIKINSDNNKNRPDLLIYTDAFAFSETNLPPYNSFTIVEFKKPQRDDYVDYDEKENPLEQIEKYVKDLLGGKVTTIKGREIKITKETPFYIYIVCDISNSFKTILENREFSKTPDGLGYYRFKDKYYSAYIEVLPFDKVLHDAKKRNRILFEKLGIDSPIN